MYFFFFNDTATTEIYTLSLHDALPIWPLTDRSRTSSVTGQTTQPPPGPGDRKSTRLNSSHSQISYAVFCLKKKKKKKIISQIVENTIYNMKRIQSLYCMFVTQRVLV